MSKLTIFDLQKELVELERKGFLTFTAEEGVKLKASEAATEEPLQNKSDFTSLLNDVNIFGGIKKPIILTSDNEILDGRHRYKIYKELGIIELPYYKLQNNYPTHILREHVRSIHMGRNKMAVQKQIQAFRYKMSTEHISWNEAANKFAVSKTALTTINTFFTIFTDNKEFLDMEDANRALDVLFNGNKLYPVEVTEEEEKDEAKGKTILDSYRFKWITKPVYAVSSAMQQLKSYIAAQKFKPTGSSAQESTTDENDAEITSIVLKGKVKVPNPYKGINDVRSQKTLNTYIEFNELKQQVEELKNQLQEALVTIKTLKEENSKLRGQLSIEPTVG